MAERTVIRVSEGALDPADALEAVADPAAGGTAMFVGTVRDRSDSGEPVEGMTYEAWPELAERRLAEVADEMHSNWPLQRVALLHRYGELEVGEVSVAVAASATHRDEAFAACRHGIERLKQEAPIWKKEHMAGGDSEWVMGS